MQDYFETLEQSVATLFSKATETTYDWTATLNWLPFWYSSIIFPERLELIVEAGSVEMSTYCYGSYGFYGVRPQPVQLAAEPIALPIANICCKLTRDWISPGTAGMQSNRIWSFTGIFL